METQDLINTLDAIITPRQSELDRLNKIKDFLNSKADPQLAALQAKSDELDVTKVALSDAQEMIDAHVATIDELQKTVDEQKAQIATQADQIATLSPAVDVSPVQPMPPEKILPQ